MSNLMTMSPALSGCVCSGRLAAERVSRLRRFSRALAVTFLGLSGLSLSGNAAAERSPGAEVLLELWSQGTPAFGQYVTQAHATGEQAGAGSQTPPRFSVQAGVDLATNPLIDFAFLSLEQHYDAESARNVATGMREGELNDQALLVRIPPISVDGAEAARERVQEVLALGADGVVIPHVLSAEEARLAVSFFEGMDVWSPSNPEGSIVAMLIIEDPEVFAELEEIAAIEGYSALVCGIGSLTSALNGDREVAEKINLQVLEASTSAGLVDLITVDAQSVALRVEQGFLGLLAYGPDSNAVLRLGRAAAGR